MQDIDFRSETALVEQLLHASPRALPVKPWPLADPDAPDCSGQIHMQIL
jgi:hypothetical protein